MAGRKMLATNEIPCKVETNTCSDRTERLCDSRKNIREFVYQVRGFLL